MATRWDDTQRRWFVDGEPVHAGAGLEMQGVVLEYDDDGEETGWNCPEKVDTFQAANCADCGVELMASNSAGLV